MTSGAEGAGTEARDAVQSVAMDARRAVAGGLIAAAAAVFFSCSRPERGVVILCAGDSITEQGYPRFLRAALRADGVRARVLNYGRSGNTSAEYLAFLDGNKEKLGAERPDIVLLELGTNDVRVDGDRATAGDFERNIREIVGVLRGFRTRTGEPPAIFLAAVPPVPEGTPFPSAPIPGPGSPPRSIRPSRPSARTSGSASWTTTRSSPSRRTFSPASIRARKATRPWPPTGIRPSGTASGGRRAELFPCISRPALLR